MVITLRERLKVAAPIILLGIFVDQLSKIWAVATLKGEPSTQYLWDTVRIGYAENIGAFLGLGNSLHPTLRFALLTAMVGIFLIGLLIYLLRGKDMDKVGLWSLSLIFAGGFSNFIDRALNEGAVVDFLNMGIGSLRTGIFNIADVYIMIGAGLIIAGQFLWQNKTNHDDSA